jgi:hypothetical protein
MLENSWFYYLSSLGQTIAGCSALLVALAVIKLQNYDNALNGIERTIAEIFFGLAEHDNYRKLTILYSRNEKWIQYFENVQNLAKSNVNKFSNSANYSQSKEFLDSIIDQGRNIEAQKSKLHSNLTYAFGGTILLAGIAIIAIPFVQWICPSILWITWLISGLCLALLFFSYIRLILNILKSKRVEVK